MENNNNNEINHNEEKNCVKDKFIKSLDWKPDEENDNKKNKLNYPKRKYAIIHGYFGHNFKGNQKNTSVRTVEDIIEKVLFKLNYISECNYGVLQKVGWSRASRTDKKVSAAFNMISCKLHKFDMDDEMKMKINKELPEDIKVFKVIEVSKSFDAKDSNNNREYHYILPSFCLKPKSSEKIIDPLTNTLDNFLGDYSFRITPEYHEKIQEICKYYKGTKKYHNYTKKMSFKEDSTNRHIYELSCNELIEYEGLQAVKFKIIGQSFLYNQIRKMIGFIIQICRDELDSKIIEHSFYSNKMDIPKAPGEGLYLYKIDYSKYNARKKDKKNEINLCENEELEMEEYRNFISEKVFLSEKKDRAFSSWLFKFDTMKDHTY